jgi:hypothetical protein
MPGEPPAGDSRTPPYLTFPRFESFLASFKGKTLPPRFDRTLVRSMSGAEQSQLNIALRFFGLVEGEERRFTHNMQKLVGGLGSDGWKSILRSIVQPAYEPIVGSLDSSASMGQLMEAFKERGGLGGSAQAKAIRFYLTAAKAADISLSPYFTAPAVPSSPRNGDRGRKGAGSRGRRQRDDGKQSDASASGNGGDGGETGGKRLKYSVPSGDIQVWLPDGVSIKELDALAKYLREYVGLMAD